MRAKLYILYLSILQITHLILLEKEIDFWANLEV